MCDSITHAEEREKIKQLEGDLEVAKATVALQSQELRDKEVLAEQSTAEIRRKCPAFLESSIKFWFIILRFTILSSYWRRP